MFNEKKGFPHYHYHISSVLIASLLCRCQFVLVSCFPQFQLSGRMFMRVLQAPSLFFISGKKIYIFFFIIGKKYTVCPGSSDPPEKILNIFASENEVYNIF